MAKERALFTVGEHELRIGQSRYFINDNTGELACVHNKDGYVMKLMTNAFATTEQPQQLNPPDAAGQLPLPQPFDTYSTSFNVIDKFDRDFFLTNFKFRHTSDMEAL